MIIKHQATIKARNKRNDTAVSRFCLRKKKKKKKNLLLLTVNVHVALLPASSLVEHVTTVTPPENVDPEKGLQTTSNDWSRLSNAVGLGQVVTP